MLQVLIIGVFLANFVVSGQPKPTFIVNWNAKTYLQITYKNSPHPQILSIYTDNQLPPYQNFVLKDSISQENSTHLLTIPLQFPQRIPCQIGQYRIYTYLVPDDTLSIEFDFNNSVHWTCKFQGKYQAIQHYYDYKGTQMGLDFDYQRGTFASEDTSLVQYAYKMDSLKKVEEQILQKYPLWNELPAWFITEERNLITYKDSYMRLNAVDYRRFIHKHSEIVPKHFFAFITEQLIYNPAVSHLPDYYRLLNDYTLVKLVKNNKLNYKKVFTWANKHLPKVCRDNWLTIQINNIMLGHPTMAAQLIARYYRTFQNKSLLDSLKAYYKDSYELKPNDLAPNFSVETYLDSLVNLNGFKDQILYISFWFTGCRPCLEAIPFENQLVQQFKNQPVKIISVCLLSKKADWLKISKRYNLETVNLYANEYWQQTIIKKYNIKSYPHYVLIDADRKVIQNNAPLPSSGEVVKLIEKLLTEKK